MATIIQTPVQEGSTLPPMRLHRRLTKNDTAKAIEKADLAEQLWRKMSQHTIFVEDTECDNEIAMSLARIKVFAENGEDDIYSECAVLKRLIELYITRQQITPASVF